MRAGDQSIRPVQVRFVQTEIREAPHTIAGALRAGRPARRRRVLEKRAVRLSSVALHAAARINCPGIASRVLACSLFTPHKRTHGIDSGTLLQVAGVGETEPDIGIQSDTTELEKKAGVIVLQQEPLEHARRQRCQERAAESMIPKSVQRFSEKIMLGQEARAG